MPHHEAKLTRSHTVRAIAAAGSILILSIAVAAPAEARGGHGFHHGFGHHGWNGADDGSFAGNRRRGNDAYAKAASEEEDKLLNTRIKSICRGC
jgi:hypothetical protein